MPERVRIGRDDRLSERTIGFVKNRSTFLVQFRKQKIHARSLAQTAAFALNTLRVSEDRRTLLKIITGIFGGGTAAAVMLPALRAIIAPMTLRTVRGVGEFVSIAPVEAVPSDGTPLKVPVVVSEPRDAWARLPPTQVGAVYLIRSEKDLIAYSTVCPHLGCGVDYATEKRAFGCPCHESAFSLDGSVSGGPSPRALDRLEVRVKDGKVEVLYQQFRQGTKDKVPT